MVTLDQLQHQQEEAAALAARAPRLFAGRVEAAACVAFPSGSRLSYHESKGSFEAICGKHPSCVLSRAGRTAVRASGRPLGLMSAWLLLDCSAVEHKCKGFLSGALSLELREAGRQYLATLPLGLFSPSI